MPIKVVETVSDASYTIEMGNRRRKDEPVRAKQRVIRKISSGWETWRKQGE